MIIISNRCAGGRAPGSRYAASCLLLGVLVVLVGTTALCLGNPVLGPLEVGRAALAGPGGPAGGPSDDLARVVVTEVRLPRVVLGLVAGAALGTAGLLVQDVLRNPVAGPELLGVSSGAAVVVVASVVLGLRLPLALTPWVALGGALLVGGLVLASLAGVRGPDQLVLVGAAVSAAAGGVVVALVGLGTEGDLVLLFRYLLGSLGGRTWEHVQVVAPFVAAGGAVAVLLARRVEALAYGDDVATGLGVPVVRTRVLALTCAAVLAAAVASVCGPVAYVALLAPHAARALVGARATRALLPTALVGAALLTAADLVSRLALYPVEVPVGIATTLVGVPGLLLVLRSRPRARPRVTAAA